MVKNYLKVAIRNITKHKFFSIINILGLTIGIAGCLFVSMYIYYELTYDHFHEKGDRIYRMNLHGKYPAHHTGFNIVQMYRAQGHEHNQRAAVFSDSSRTWQICDLSTP